MARDGHQIETEPVDVDRHPAHGLGGVPAKQFTEYLEQVTCGNCRRSLVGATKVTDRAWETFVRRGGKT